MINIEANLNHWEDDKFKVGPSSQISVKNFVWNKLLKKAIIQFLEDEFGEDNKIVKCIKNKAFSGLVKESTNFPSIGQVEFYYVEGIGNLVTENEYDVLMSMLIDDECIENISKFVFKDEIESNEEITNDDLLYIYLIMTESIPYILKSADDESLVTLNSFDKYSLENVYDLLIYKYGEGGNEIKNSKGVIRSEEDLQKFYVEYFMECGIPKDMAIEYSNGLMEIMYDMLEWDKIDSKHPEYLEYLESGIPSVSFLVLGAYISYT